MSAPSLARLLPDTSSVFAMDSFSDRRADVELKQERVAALLRETNRDGLLLVAPENFAWMTSGATPRGVLDPSSAPVVYCTAEGRWVICGNMDTQRTFDEEIDALGFQLKEWPWHWGRAGLLADLCANRKVAIDGLPGGAIDGDFVLVNEALRRLRLRLTPYEQACLAALGQVVAHALEATCRNLARGESEREAAGHLAHRLLKRGAMPTHLGVIADGRSRLYRRFGYTTAPVERYAVLTATGRKYGLHATASRVVSFGEPPDDLKHEMNAACRVTASYLASTWPDAVPREVLLAGARVYAISDFEHEWLQAPQGHLTGRSPVELLFTPQTAALLEPGMAVTWTATAGAALSSDTFLVTAQGPQPVTAPESWPVKRIRTQGTESARADVLVRE